MICNIAASCAAETVEKHGRCHKSIAHLNVTYSRPTTVLNSIDPVKKEDRYEAPIVVLQLSITSDARGTYLHFNSFQRIPTSGPRFPRYAVKLLARNDSTRVVAAVEVGHVASVVPPGTSEAPRAATVLEVSINQVVVDVERRELAAVVFEQWVPGHSAAAERLFTVPGDVQPVAVNLVCDAEVIVVHFMCQVVPVGQADAQWVLVLVSEQVDHFVPKPVLAGNTYTTTRTSFGLFTSKHVNNCKRNRHLFTCSLDKTIC